MSQLPDLETLSPGTYHTALTYGHLPDGSELRVPYSIIAGAQPHPRVVVTAGVHGDEFEGVRAVADLCAELVPEQLQGTVVLVPIVNPPAFNAGTRVSPLDGVNLNRVFPGNPSGTISERLASALFQQVIAGADMLVDLHSGGTRYLFHPQAGFYDLGGDLGARSFALAQAFGLDLLWNMPPRPGVCSHEAMRAGVAAIGVEIGGNGRCEPEHVAAAKRGVYGVLAHAGVLPMESDRPQRQRIWQDDFTLCPVSGLFEPAVTLNQEVAAGQLLYTIRDTLGQVRYQHYAPSGGLVSAMRIFAAIQEGEWDISILRPADRRGM
jgi:predicted deacylase